MRCVTLWFRTGDELHRLSASRVGYSPSSVQVTLAAGTGVTVITAAALFPPLVAVMFAAEHACRRFALPHEPRPRMVDAVRAYRATTHASQPSR